MTTEEALLAAIWESPHDDLPRLVYADFLEETGDLAKAARAEFIRVQCELAKLDEFDDHYDSLERVEKELLGTWGDSFRPYLPREAVGVNFDRGFVLPVTRIGMKRLRTRGPNLLANAPLWTFEFCLNDDTEDLRLLTQTAKLHCASCIHFCSCRHQNRSERGRWLAEGECFVNLRSLGLGGAFDCLDSTDQFEAFCRTANMPLLERLFIPGERIGIESVRHLAEAPFAPGLRSLAMSLLSNLSPDDFSHLVSAPTFTGLQHLDVSGFGGQSPGDYLRVFAQRAAVPKLKRLSFFSDGIVDDLTEAFRGWPGALTLKVLSVGQCTDDAVRALIAARVLPNLRKLIAHIPGYSTVAQLETSSNDIVVPDTTPGNPTYDLIEFAKGHGVKLVL